MTLTSIKQRPRLSIFFQLDPFNPTIGGIQTCIKYVLKYAPEDFRIQLIGITQSQAAVGKWQKAELHGREFDFLPLLQVEDDNIRTFVPTTLKYALALKKYLRSQPLASEFYQFHRIEPTLFAQRLSGTKLLYIHNDIYQEIKGGTRGGILWKRFPWAYFALERKLVSQFNFILSCNSQSAQLYQQQYPDIADRVSYLPNTFDSELFYPLTTAEKNIARTQLARRLSLPADTRFILFAGRLHPQKQPHLLIQSLAQLNVSKAHLIIVGKGELESDVHQEAERLGVTSQVSFLGSLPQHELAALYQTSDLFVLTSAYEGLARSSLEALACGIPVVTTRAGETPNFLARDSGLVCETDTPEVISQDWRKVLQNPTQFPSEACVRVAQPYEASHVVQSLYGDLLAQWQASQCQVLSPSASAPSASSPSDNAKRLSLRE
ncbi:MAG: glycosyltransferase family 4 protein [Cyanobacteria bacterium J06632_3]